MEIKKFIVNPIQVNCYLLWDETGEALLIDCGAWFPNEREQIRSFLQTEGLTLKHYLNTHLHFDHIFGNAFVEETFGVKAWASDGDWHWAANIKERVARFGIKYEEDVPALGRILKDGDEILFGNQRAVAIAVPGHSPGSLCYYCKEDAILFSGDVLFKESIGRTDLYGGSYKALNENITSKIFTLPDNTIVYCGHGPTTTIGYEKEYNPYL